MLIRDAEHFGSKHSVKQIRKWNKKGGFLYEMITFDKLLIPKTIWVYFEGIFNI